jgi:two-component system, chemotaxis family, protein-glutamate methylesterase/glutaminase
MQVIKVLIVDDSALVRQTYKSLLENEPDIQVIGTAGDPYIAVQKIQKEKPDVITLDIEMPRMDGLTFLKKIMAQAPMPVVVISNQTVNGADVALKALEAGAVDVMAKPGVANPREMAESQILLADKIRSAFYSKRSDNRTTDNVSRNRTNTINKAPQLKGGNIIIAVGASTGGTEAIRHFLQHLPAGMPPIVIVQHMPEKFTTSFAKRLNDICTLTVKEAEDNDPVMPGMVYIAPGNHHMIVQQHLGKTTIKTYRGDLVNRHRPSVNVLFHSVAEAKGKHAIGVIMTGMGDDGAAGLLAMHQRGAYTIAQDEESSVVFGMPHKAIQAGGANEVLPLNSISKTVCNLIQPNSTSDTVQSNIGG